MTPDIKAIREAAEAVRFKAWGMDYVKGANPATVIALCDEVEILRYKIGAYQLHEKQLLAAKMGLECEVDRLRIGMSNIANQSTEPAIREFASSYLESKQ